MHTALTTNNQIQTRAPEVFASTDPVEPIHEYYIPILPFKRSPLPEDFAHPKKRERKPDQEPRQTPHKDGHVDDYA
jgi:hypothetical protein